MYFLGDVSTQNCSERGQCYLLHFIYDESSIEFDDENTKKGLLTDSQFTDIVTNIKLNLDSHVKCLPRVQDKFLCFCTLNDNLSSIQSIPNIGAEIYSKKLLLEDNFNCCE